MTALLPLLLNWKTWVAGLIAALLVMVAVDGFRIKRANAELKATHAQLAQALADAALKAKQASVSGKIDASHIAADAAIRTQFQTLTQKATRYVPVSTDTQCIVPGSVVSLLNASVSGLSLPDAPSLADGAPSGTRFSDIVANDLANTQAARLNKQQVLDWQAWAKAQQALNP